MHRKMPRPITKARADHRANGNFKTFSFQSIEKLARDLHCCSCLMRHQANGTSADAARNHRPAFADCQRRTIQRSKGDFKPMRILVADPHPIPTGDIQAQLCEQPAVLDWAPNRQEVLHFLRAYRHDVILLGCENADATTVDFVRHLRVSGNTLPIVGIGRRIGPRARAALLDAGVDDVVLLPCDAHEFAGRLRAVIRRSTGFARSVLRLGGVELDMASRSATFEGQEIKLSPMEYGALELLFLRKNTLVAKTALMEALYAADQEPDTKSMDVLIHRLRKRLERAGTGPLINTVWGAGYLARETAAPERAPADVQRHDQAPQLVAFMPTRGARVGAQRVAA